VSYLIGGARWTSNDIEHGALRGNAPSPAHPFSLLGKPQWAGRTFKKDDPRAKLAIQVGSSQLLLFMCIHGVGSTTYTCCFCAGTDFSCSAHASCSWAPL
jgi:hypothetical protein